MDKRLFDCIKETSATIAEKNNACEKEYTAFMKSENLKECWDCWQKNLSISLQMLRKDGFSVLEQYYNDCKDDFNALGVYYNEASNKGFVILTEGSFELRGEVKAWAYGTSKVTLFDTARVRAFDQTEIVLHDKAYATLSDESTCIAYDKSEVNAQGNNFVEAYNECIITAGASSHVKAYGWKKITAAGQSIVFAPLNSNIKVSGESSLKIVKS